MTKKIDWSELHEDIDYTCPFCDGTGRVYQEFDEMNNADRRAVIEEVCKDKDLNTLRDVLGYVFTNDRVGIDEDIKEYYEEWKEDIDIDKECEYCTYGNIEPLYNSAYSLEYTKLNDDNKKKALDCGLFLFEDEFGTAWMSLTGCGMDFTPNILMAYRILEGYIPYEWATEWRADYHANIPEKEHVLNAISCKVSIENEANNAQGKLKNLEIFFSEPKKRGE